MRLVISSEQDDRFLGLVLRSEGWRGVQLVDRQGLLYFWWVWKRGVEDSRKRHVAVGGGLV